MTAKRMLLLVGMVLLPIFGGFGCTTVSPHSIVMGQANEEIGIAGAEVFVEEAEACTSSVLVFPSTGNASLFAAMEKLDHKDSEHRLAYITTDIRSTWALFSTTRCTVVRAHYVKGAPADSVDLFAQETDDEETTEEESEGWVASSKPESDPEPEGESTTTVDSTESRIQGEALVDEPERLSKRGIVLGTSVRIRTRSGRTADGIFKSYREEKLVILVTADAELKLDIGEIEWIAKIDAVE